MMWQTHPLQPDNYCGMQQMHRFQLFCLYCLASIDWQTCSRCLEILCAWEDYQMQQMHPFWYPINLYFWFNGWKVNTETLLWLQENEAWTISEAWWLLDTTNASVWIVSCQHTKMKLPLAMATKPLWTTMIHYLRMEVWGPVSLAPLMTTHMVIGSTIVVHDNQQKWVSSSSTAIVQTWRRKEKQKRNKKTHAHSPENMKIVPEIL
jgi:hypothetical protein